MPYTNSQPVVLNFRDRAAVILSVVLSEYGQHPEPLNVYAFTPEHVEQLIAKHVEAGAFPVPTSWRVLYPHEIPQDRTFREAWRDGGAAKGIVHDMSRVRSIYLERVRAERAERFKVLDADYSHIDARASLAERDVREMPVPRGGQVDAYTADQQLAKRRAASELRNRANAIEAERQRLRDLPTTLAPALDAAQTIDDVKRIRPFE